jgi:uncharacterized protein|tara:strand:- start:3671 stop:4408 length:738 start_codon:yes stop_codon:yes gene_type:complete
MPPFKNHLETSKERTGTEYIQVHEWLDIDLEKKSYRHNLLNISENYKHVINTFGYEGGLEWLHHITQDLEKKTKEIELLKKIGVPQKAIQHSIKVAEKSLEIAARVKKKADIEIIRQGGLFHDIGKSKTYDIEHGKIGAEIALELGMSKKVMSIIEKHIRGGMSKEEAEELGLPIKDYCLQSLEEKIVIYSDRIVDIIQDNVANDKEAEIKFEEILEKYERYGKNSKTKARYFNLHHEIQNWMKM